MKLIDKDALVAEIERRISVLKANESVISMLAGGMFVNEFKDLLSFLDTLEVKKVDSTAAFIEKACEWLKFNYVEFTDNSRLGLNINELIKDFKKDFKKAMEE